MASASQPAASHPPSPYDAGTSVAGALIEHPTLGFLLQLRDEHAPTYPLHWSLFGGHIEAGEAPVTALWRELAEELHMAAEQVIRWQFVQRNPRLHGGHQFIFHIVTHATTDELVLGEGKAMRYLPQAQVAEAITTAPPAENVSAANASAQDAPAQPQRPVSLLGHGLAANIDAIFRDHFAGRRDAPDRMAPTTSADNSG